MLGTSRSTEDKTWMGRAGLCSVLAIASAIAFAPAAKAQQRSDSPSQRQSDDQTDSATSDSDVAQSAGGGASAAIGDIVVTGVRGSLVSAQQAKRDAAIVADFVTPEDVGKYTDQNLAETLQRVPGVQISRSQSGEGMFVSIRGLGPNFVSTTINGRTAFGGSGGDDGLGNRNAFALDAVAPELVAGIEVYKSTKADIQEGGIGGAVNILTARPLDMELSNALYDDGLYVALNADMSYSTEANKGDPRLSGFFSWRNKSGTLGLLGNIAYYDRSTLTQIARIITTDFDDTIDGVENVYRPASDSEYALNDGHIRRLGYGITAQWRPSDVFELTLDMLNNHQKTERYQNTLRMRLPADIAPLIENPDVLRVDAPNIGGVLLGGTIRRRAGLPEADQPYSSIAPNYTTFDRDEQSYGGHITVRPSDRLRIDADASYFKSDFNRGEDLAAYEVLGVNGFEYRADVEHGAPTFTFLPDPTTGAPFDVNNLELGQPVDFGFNRIFAGGDEFGSRLDVDYDVDALGLSRIEIGGAYRRRKQDQVFNVIRYNQSALDDLLVANGVDPATTPDFQNTARRLISIPAGGLLSELPSVPHNSFFALDPREVFGFYRPSIDAALAAQGVSLDKRGADPALGLQFGPFGGNGFFSAREDIYAAYAMADLDSHIFGMRYRANIGLRVVHTDRTGTGLQTASQIDAATQNTIAVDENGNPIVNTTRISNSGSATEYLPSGNIAFEISDSIQLRFAASKVVTRPDLGVVAGASSISFDSNDGSTITGINISLPNPAIQPFRAWQYDAIAEWYPTGSGAFLAAGYFYKDIKSLITTQTTFPNELTLNGITYQATDDIPLRVTQAVNNAGGGAVVSGLELQGHLPFNVLVASGVISHLGVQATYTRLLQNETPITDPATGERLPFDGASKNNYSIVGYYDDGKFSIRGSYTYRSRSSVGGGIFNESYASLDGNLDYQVTPNFGLRLQVTNLLQEPFRQTIANGRLPYIYSQNGRLITLGARVQF